MSYGYFDQTRIMMQSHRYFWRTFTIRLHVFHGQRDTGRHTAATDTHEDGIQFRYLLNELSANRALWEKIQDRVYLKLGRMNKHQ